jgi:hypothetical protein
MIVATTTRKFSYVNTKASDASGLITLNASGCADVIGFLGTEFSNFAQEWTEFRVKSYSLHWFPSTTNATSTTGPFQGGYVVAPWAQLKPTTLTSMQQSNQLVKFSTMEEKEICVIRPTGPNFLLWNPVGTVLPIDRDFGLVESGISTVAVSSTIYTRLYELEVEFRLPA